MQHLKKIFPLAFISFAFANTTFGQVGSVTATFTSNTGISKPVTFKFSKPLFKFNNSHGYWVTNPRTGSRHATIQPDAGYGDTDAPFISISESENDTELYTGTSNDSTSVTFSNKLYTLEAPKYDVQNKEANKPMKLHIVTFTPSEIVFTISGNAKLLKRTGYDAKGAEGTISANAHFYREAKYDKSDVLPGCNCDPTIYATVFDEESAMVRTTSDCENALNNKVYDAVQKGFAPVFNHLKSTDNVAGSIMIDMIAGHANIDVPPLDRPYCSSPYYHNSLTGVYAQRKNYSSDDKYGIRFGRVPASEATDAYNDTRANITQRIVTITDSLSKLLDAKKITPEEYNKVAMAAMQTINTNAPDIKQLEVENHLYIYVILNPESTIDLKLADKKNTAVQHKIKGAAFEIFSGQVKDNDGDWLGNRYNIYFGKYTAPVAGKAGAGFDALNTKPIYPANSNKLTVYNIVIKMDGAKDLIDKAVANIDFNALQSLITKQ